MAKYVAVSMANKPRILKKFSSSSAAQKWRTKYYKTHKRAKVGILGSRGLISPRTY